MASTRRCGPSDRSAAIRSSSTAGTARTSSTPKVASISTTCSRGARRSSAMRIPPIVEAVQRAAADGTSFGAPTAREVELAEAICERVPSVEKVRLVSSGTEAAMTAVRLARGVDRPAEDREVRRLLPRPSRLAVGAGREWGRDARAARARPGVTPGTVADTIVVPYNDLAALDRALAEHGHRRRRDPRGADRREHGARRARERVISPVCAIDARRRRAPRVRRGHHRLPGRDRRRPGAIRDHARPVDLRQGRGWRSSARRGRRPGER